MPPRSASISRIFDPEEVRRKADRFTSAVIRVCAPLAEVVISATEAAVTDLAGGHSYV
jgi:hypothetical protein